MKTNKELKRIARERLFGHYKPAIGGMLLAELIPTIILIPFSLILTTDSTMDSVIYLLASIAVSLLSVILACGLNFLHLNIARGRAVLVSDIFACFKNKPDAYILAYLFYIVKLLPCFIPLIPAICAVAFISDFALSMILFFVFYVLVFVMMIIQVLRYAFVFYLQVDDPHARIRDTFRESKRLMKGHKKQLFILAISFIGWMLLSLLSLGIAFLWVAPYINQTSAAFYLAAKEEPAESYSGYETNSDYETNSGYYTNSNHENY